MDLHLEDIREEYKQAELHESSVKANPLEQFDIWFKEALLAKVPEVNAMTLATADSKGIPNARIVLLKHASEEGFSFYTNYVSEKGEEMAKNPFVALVFFWSQLERQVRVLGQVEKLSVQESTAYFHSRPIGSQLGAWASPQSKEIPNREYLQKRIKELETEYEGNEVPKPPHWGGYLVRPFRVEFWQGRPNRLHDRIRYELVDNNWEIVRLAP
ncbi:pyridoxamine 5'-phosphate oxidase [Olivibacter sitiensis]|uniref:pyridoxamine 5'-phosphate oxidase n=1 Tax=Olivibacter sitiensis TaxID=376470 RepID=UPI0004212DB0|nr:pyridoxamine 5'-phosphate oxidase [Olivibacter sitiensis]